eukprot:1156716-Pelagomonas_calceolata.AAC.1
MASAPGLKLLVDRLIMLQCQILQGGHWGGMLVEGTIQRGHLHGRKDLRQLAHTANLYPNFSIGLRTLMVLQTKMGSNSGLVGNRQADRFRDAHHSFALFLLSLPVPRQRSGLACPRVADMRKENTYGKLKGCGLVKRVTNSTSLGYVTFLTFHMFCSCQPHTTLHSPILAPPCRARKQLLNALFRGGQPWGRPT